MGLLSLQPVTVAGIEFDALISESKQMTAEIPQYPVEYGFPVSDTMTLDPKKVSMELYLSSTPLTWLSRHGTGMGRVIQICDQLESLWLSRQLISIKTSTTSYSNMGITSLQINNTQESKYARVINLQAQEVRVTQKMVTAIPAYSLKSGATGANAGISAPSTSSSKTGGKSGGANAGGGSASYKNYGAGESRDNSLAAQSRKDSAALSASITKQKMGV